MGVGRELEGNHLRQYSQEGRKAYSKYLLKRYGGKEYLLLKDGVVLCNLTNYDLLPGNENRWQSEKAEYVIQRTDGVYILVAGREDFHRAAGNLSAGAGKGYFQCVWKCQADGRNFYSGTVSGARFLL